MWESYFGINGYERTDRIFDNAFYKQGIQKIHYLSFLAYCIISSILSKC